jgi:hypothetical protein
MTTRTERVTEARRLEALPGDRTLDEFRTLISDALKEKYGTTAPNTYLWLRDATDTWAIYEVEGPNGLDNFRVEFTVADDGAVSFTTDPVEVEAKTTFEPVGGGSSTTVTEAVHVEAGRVLEAKGTDTAGGRVFAVQVIVPGTSRNGIRYPANVLEAAAPLYEGVKAFDHHRTDAELRSSTVVGLVGHYRNAQANAAGITADLHLLPSATHIAEALEASIDAQAQGLPPIVGISHDVSAQLTPAVEGGRRIQEATAIAAVRSADVVADPSAGGLATRVVAGGIGSDPHDTTTQGDTMNLKQLLTLLRQAKAEDRAALLQEHADVVEASGYTSDEVAKLVDVVESPEAPAPEAKPDPAATGAEAEEKEPVLVTESISAKVLIRAAVSDAGLDDSFVPVVTDQLGKRFTESDLGRAVAGYRRVLEGFEQRTLRPGVPHVQVTSEDIDKKRDRLLKTFEGDYQAGYHSIHEAFIDITGLPASELFAGDIGALIVRESQLNAPVEGQRVTESLTTGSWGEVLADVMNKRVVAEYRRPALQEWRQLVNVVPLKDFRSQKLVRLGGLGTLPVVPEGALYQPLTSAPDEQATYSPSKRGGTEDFTYEMAKNDDLRGLVAIPRLLVRAAAITLYRGVFDIFPTNPTIYDSETLFATAHANTDNPAVLTQSTLSVGRRKMREQAAYGDSVDVLGLLPRFILVPPELEEQAFKLTASAVAVPASGEASDMPNIHQGLKPIVVDYWTDANDWFLAADPADAPSIEVGFLDGKQDPELFVQDDPRVGSHFNADKTTYKVRHIWGIGIPDFRPYYRGAN